MTEAANLESFFATFSFSPHAGHAGVAEALGTSVSKLFPHFLQTYSKMGIVVLLVWSRGNLHPFSESCKRLRGVSCLSARFQNACGSVSASIISSLTKVSGETGYFSKNRLVAMRGNPGPSHFLSGCGASFANLRDQLFRHRFKKLFRPAIFYFHLRMSPP